MEKKADVAIIGSGLTGISLAKKITNQVTLVLDKSKGIGGRVATRRMGLSFVNHGVEDFEVAHPYLKNLVSIGVAQNLIQLKDNVAVPEGNLNQWIKHLAHELNIIREFEVTHFEIRNDQIIIHQKNNADLIIAKKIVLCIPAPQASQILKNSGLDSSFLLPVVYRPQVQFFILLKREIPINLTETKDYYLKKMTSNSEQEYLYHFEIKDEHISDFLDLTKDEISKYFLIKFDELKQYIIETHAHKWRYSRVLQSIDSKWQFKFSEKGIYLAGDYFFGNDLNSALKSVDSIWEKIH